jgi:hypothetical protein
VSATALLIYAVSPPMNMLPLSSASIRGSFLVLEVLRGLPFEQKLLVLGLLILGFALILRALGFWDDGHTHDDA